MKHIPQRDRPMPNVPKEVFRLWADWADSTAPWPEKVKLWDKFLEEKKKWHVQDGKWTPANQGVQAQLF